MIVFTIFSNYLSLVTLVSNRPLLILLWHVSQKLAVFILNIIKMLVKIIQIVNFCEKFTLFTNNFIIYYGYFRILLYLCSR